MTETPLYFENDNYRLFGVLHFPDENGRFSGYRQGMVICNPFAEEKMIAHRNVVNLARSLASEGIACLRFDYMGEGDSENNFEDSSISSRLSDISAAISLLIEKTGATSVGLLGIRFGATLAVLASAGNKLDSLVLVSPLVSGKQYIEKTLRSNLTVQLKAYGRVIKDRSQLISDLRNKEFVNIDGYLLSEKLYDEMGEIDLMNCPEPSADHILIINIISGGQGTDLTLNNLYERIMKFNPETTMMDVQAAPFWKDGKLYSPSSESLNKALIQYLWETCR